MTWLFDKTVPLFPASPFPALKARLSRLAVLQMLFPLLAFCLSLLAVFFPGTAEARYSAILVDADSGRVIYSRNPDQRRYPASLTKIMTLYLVFEAMDRGELTLGQRLPVSARAAGQTPTKLGLKRGETIRVEDAILGVITKSANDAATVLAEALAPTEAAFAQKMTQRARELGMSRTSFRNASGLPNRYQRSTARDMATLGAAMLENHKKYYHYFSRASFEWEGHHYRNHNNLLEDYDGVDGIKTGYIRASGFNLVASVKRDGRRLIGVVFGGRTAKSRDRRMVELFDRGFARLAEIGDDPLPVPRRKPIALASRSGAKDAMPVTPTPAKAEMIASLPSQNREEGDWGIQVGAFSRSISAHRGLHLAAGLAPELLHRRRISIMEVEGQDSVVFRARMLGFTKTDAATACQVLKKKNFACAVVTPDGTLNLALAQF